MQRIEVDVITGAVRVLDLTPEEIAALPPAPPPAVPALISDRQFYQQLAIMGRITTDEALAAVKTGTLPALLQSYVSSLPTGQQFGATMLLAGATQFERAHPLTAAIGAAQGMSAADIDAFFIAAAAL